jgi:hypothetical protein
MDPTYPPQLLFLKNVVMADCKDVTDQFNERILAESEMPMFDAQTIILNYDKIPNRFTSIENWPTKTNLRCWYCTLKHSNVPIFIPTIISEMDGSIEVLGTYCSFSCMVADIPTYYNIHKQWEITEKAKILYRKFYGRIVSSIPPSLPKSNLELYGGKMTVEEYTRHLAKLGKQIRDNSELIRSDV